MTFPLTFRPTFPFLGGDISKRTRFGNSETFQRFVQLRFEPKSALFCFKCVDP